ncbi:hypothetical protein GCM10022206_38920 [Streptomyces chiangmaiensis]
MTGRPLPVICEPPRRATTSARAAPVRTRSGEPLRAGSRHLRPHRLPVTDIAGRVRVHGRGGTVLQPGIDLLHRAQDLPPGAPVLVITDGWCDVRRMRREHAYPIPQGARLPFTPQGPVFRVR